MPTHRPQAGRRWRDYGATSGRSPLKDVIVALPLDERAAAAAMKDVSIHGNSVAHHLRGDTYEEEPRMGSSSLRHTPHRHVPPAEGTGDAEERRRRRRGATGACQDCIS